MNEKQTVDEIIYDENAKAREDAPIYVVMDMTFDNVAFGNMIADLVDKIGVKLVSEISGYHENTVIGMKNNRPTWLKTMPSMGRFLNLCNAADRNPADFFILSDSKNRDGE